MSFGKALLLVTSALVVALSVALVSRFQVVVIPAADGSEYRVNRLTGSVDVRRTKPSWHSG